MSLIANLVSVVFVAAFLLGFAAMLWYLRSFIGFFLLQRRLIGADDTDYVAFPTTYREVFDTLEVLADYPGREGANKRLQKYARHAVISARLTKAMFVSLLVMFVVLFVIVPRE